MSLKDKILDADDSPLFPIEVPEWGIKKGEAFIRPLDGESRFRISQLAGQAKSGNANTYITEAYVCEGLVDKDGNQAFEFKDRAKLAKKNPVIVDRIFDAVLEHSGMGSTAQAAAEKK